MDTIKNIIIVGAGGFGREVYAYIRDDFIKGYLADYRFKGFVDDSYDNFKSARLDAAYLGIVDDFQFEENDQVIVPIGNVSVRNRIIAKLKARGVSIFSYIHHSAFVAYDAVIGEGVLICPNCMVHSRCTIGDNVVLNVFCSIGHDSHLGKNAILSPYCTLNGGVYTGDNLFMGTRSTLLLGSSVGHNCMIAAHSVIKGNKLDNLILKNRVETLEVKNRFIKDKDE